MRRIYVASSWRNAYQPGVVAALREAGHQAYDFRHPKPGDDGFSWREIEPGWESWTTEQYVAALQHPISQRGFRNDWEGMQWADTCVMVLPCGRSANLEAGWFVGAGRELFVLQPERCEPELMYLMATGICSSIEQVLEALAIPPRLAGHASEIERLRVANKAAEDAITYTLVRARREPDDLGYHLGPHSQAFEDLCRALALMLDKPLAEVRSAAARRLP